MGLDATTRRRWFGGIVLTAALVMLVCGQTKVPSTDLGKILFLLYWPVCFILTGLAAIIALRDMQELRRRTREQQKELLDTALKEIEKETRSRGDARPSR
jgi:hypothetical protein